MKIIYNKKIDWVRSIHIINMCGSKFLEAHESKVKPRLHISHLVGSVEKSACCSAAFLVIYVVKSYLLVNVSFALRSVADGDLERKVKR